MPDDTKPSDTPTPAPPPVDDRIGADPPEPTPETLPVEGPSLEDLTTERDALKGQLESMSGMAGILRDAGITKVDDLRTRLATPAGGPGAPDLQKLLAALSPETPGKPAVPAKAGEFSIDDIKTLVTDAVKESMGTLEAARTEKEYTDASSVELSLKSRVFSDPRFKSLVGGNSFADAFGGTKGRAAKAFAVLADHMFYERGLKSSDGSYAPVTDVSAVADIAGELGEMFRELKAATIHELSTDPAAPETPDVPSETPEEVIGANLGETDWDIFDKDEEAAKRKRDAAIQSTFEKLYRRADAASRGLPSSAQAL
jgi:hypothetical protein